MNIFDNFLDLHFVCVFYGDEVGVVGEGDG
jgi:hypothetical protein